MKNQQNEMLSLVYLMAEYHDHEISDSKAAMLAMDLEGFTPKTISDAWVRYRKNAKNTRMPNVGQLVELIEDGNPCAQIAWGMMPKSEDDSIVWSDEMREAWAVSWPLIREGNVTGAYFAFKEAYEAAVLKCRTSGKSPKWSASFGHRKSGRELAVVEAVSTKRISLDYALKIYPELESSNSFESLQIEHSGSKQQIEYPRRDTGNLLNIAFSKKEIKNV